MGDGAWWQEGVSVMHGLLLKMVLMRCEVAAWMRRSYCRDDRLVCSLLRIQHCTICRRLAWIEVKQSSSQYDDSYSILTTSSDET